MAKHKDFVIGKEFTCGEKRWRCTDIGSRVIIAICLSDHADDPSWFKGPPYAVAESVFNEYDILACKLDRKQKEIPKDLVRPGLVWGHAEKDLHAYAETKAHLKGIPDTIAGAKVHKHVTGKIKPLGRR